MDRRYYVITFILDSHVSLRFEYIAIDITRIFVHILSFNILLYLVTSVY